MGFRASALIPNVVRYLLYLSLSLVRYRNVTVTLHHRFVTFAQRHAEFLETVSAHDMQRRDSCFYH